MKVGRGCRRSHPRNKVSLARSRFCLLFWRRPRAEPRASQPVCVCMRASALFTRPNALDRLQAVDGAATTERAKNGRPLRLALIKFTHARASERAPHMKSRHHFAALRCWENHVMIWERACLRVRGKVQSEGRRPGQGLLCSQGVKKRAA